VASRVGGPLSDKFIDPVAALLPGEVIAVDGKTLRRTFDTASTKALIGLCAGLAAGADGVRDGMIENPRARAFDYATLACKGTDGPSCLTPAKWSRPEC
jgi:hypothetical protein